MLNWRDYLQDIEGFFFMTYSHSLSGPWDSLAGVDVWCVWSSHYCPRMARAAIV